jgi:hypothetical protein
MHSFRAGRLAGSDDLVDQQVGLRGRRRADVDGLVGHLHVHRLRVGVRIDGYRLDPHPPGGLDDAAGDLAAVGDQDFLEHVRVVPEFDQRHAVLDRPRRPVNVFDRPGLPDLYPHGGGRGA